MAPWPTIELVEFFHLSFLGVLQVRLDQTRYILKGGANLRYFYSSPRSSEDIDFDAVQIDRATLEAKVDGVLASRPLALTLRTQDLAVTAITKPKQTETTQRWKLTLAAAGRSELIRTKVEFSHRAPDDRCQLDQIPPEIAARYTLRSPTVRRYLPSAVIEQKIAALTGRRETQVRDIFDLDLLFRRWPTAVKPGTISPDRLEIAIERTLELPFESYESLVVRFLDADLVELYNRPEAWSQMQDHVAEKLAALR